MERFLSLPTWIRMGVLVLVAVLAVLLAVWSQSTNEKEQEQEIIDTSVDIDNSPTGQPTDPTAEPTASPTAEPQTGLGLSDSPEWVGQMNLEPDDAIAARAATETSLIEYYRFVPTETEEVRNARLTAVIAPGSEAFETTPWGDYESMVNEDGTTIEGAAAINTLDDIGGNGDEYRAFVSLNAEMLITFPADSGERPQVFQGYQEVEVRMVRVNGVWMLGQVIEQ